MSSEQGRGDVASDDWKTMPRPRLREEHFVVLRAVEKGTVPDLTLTRYRIAMSECRRWSLVLASSIKLSVLGERELAAHRERIARKKSAAR